MHHITQFFISWPLYFIIPSDYPGPGFDSLECTLITKTGRHSISNSVNSVNRTVPGIHIIKNKLPICILKIAGAILKISLLYVEANLSETILDVFLIKLNVR